jgi:hypothetical protein
VTVTTNFHTGYLGELPTLWRSSRSIPNDKQEPVIRMHMLRPAKTILIKRCSFEERQAQALTITSSEARKRPITGE